MAYRCSARYDFAELVRMVRRMHAERYGHGARLTEGEVYEQLGLSKRQAGPYVRRGLSYVQADHLANRLGFHPSAIWPGEWFVDLEAAA